MFAIAMSDAVSQQQMFSCFRARDVLLPCHSSRTEPTVSLPNTTWPIRVNKMTPRSTQRPTYQYMPGDTRIQMWV